MLNAIMQKKMYYSLLITKEIQFLKVLNGEVN